MADYKIVYFACRARAEPARLTLAAAGVKFDDVMLTGEEFAAERSKTPYGMLPYLVYKGKNYGESKAITSFLARECGMAGKTSVDAMVVDEVYCLAADIMESFGKLYFEQDAEKKAEMEKKLDTETIPKFTEFFNKKIKDNGCNGYVVGSQLTQADLTVYDIMETVLGRCPTALDGFPEIKKVRANVEANPKVKAYLDKRPKFNI